jgi:hypothetical protein
LDDQLRKHVLTYIHYLVVLGVSRLPGGTENFKEGLRSQNPTIVTACINNLAMQQDESVVAEIFAAMERKGMDKEFRMSAVVGLAYYRREKVQVEIERRLAAWSGLDAEYRSVLARQKKTARD